MNLASVSNAPKIFSAPLISSERSTIFEKILSAAIRAFQWIRSLFAFVVPLKKETVEALPTLDIKLARRALQVAEAAKPSPLRFLRT